jgi:hypothetical protein
MLWMLWFFCLRIVVVPSNLLDSGWARPNMGVTNMVRPTEAQLGMFPRRIDIVMPHSGKSKDLLLQGIADDGQVYFLKHDANGKPEMASEWLGTKISERIGIAVAECTPIQTPDGHLVFGSRKVSGAAEAIDTAEFMTTPSVDEFGQGEGFPGSYFSMIHALDLFLKNVDRHYGNFVSVREGGSRRLFAIDFGRSLFWDWPLNGFPVGNDQTVIVGRRLRRLHRFDRDAAQSVVELIRNLPGSAIEKMISDMPEGWLSPRLAEEFLTFWNGEGRQVRLNALSYELANAPAI